MLWSTQETLAVMESHLPQPLISPAAFQPITRLARVLPDVMSSYYLECRLAAEQPQVDLLACATVPAITSICQTPEDKRSGKTRPSGFPMEDPVWQRVEQLCTRLAEPDSVLSGRVPHFWLAFDSNELAQGMPRPCVLMCLDPDYFSQHEDAGHLNTLADQTYQDIVEAALGVLLPDSISTHQQHNLLACATCLPPGGHIIHMSVMTARTPSVVRLNITLPTDQLIPYLRVVEWTGDFAALASLLARYCVFPDRVKIQLTIGETITPRIDFEFHCKGSLSDDARWQSLLANVVADGLCAPDKGEAVYGWPGSLRETFPHMGWPTRFQKWLDLKIIAHDDASLEAKAYLGFMPSNSIF